MTTRTTATTTARRGCCSDPPPRDAYQPSIGGRGVGSDERRGQPHTQREKKAARNPDFKFIFYSPRENCNDGDNLVGGSDDEVGLVPAPGQPRRHTRFRDHRPRGWPRQAPCLAPFMSATERCGSLAHPGRARAASAAARAVARPSRRCGAHGEEAPLPRRAACEPDQRGHEPLGRHAE